MTISLMIILSMNFGYIMNLSLIGDNIKQHHEHIKEDESTCASDLCYNIMNIDKEKCKLVGKYGTLTLYKQLIITLCKKYNLQ